MRTKAMHTQRDDACYQHLKNSMQITKMLEEKAKKFDYDFQKKCVDAKDYEALEMYVLTLLMDGS